MQKLTYGKTEFEIDIPFEPISISATKFPIVFLSVSIAIVIFLYIGEYVFYLMKSRRNLLGSRQNRKAVS